MEETKKLTPEHFEEILPDTVKAFFKNNLQYNTGGAIDTLFKTMKYEVPADVNLDGAAMALEHIASILEDALTPRQRLEKFYLVCSCEGFLKKVLYVVNPIAYKNYNDNELMLAALMKKHLGLSQGRDRVNDLSDLASLKDRSFNEFAYHMITVYSLRNEEAHEWPAYNQSEIYTYLDSILILYITTIVKNKSFLDKTIKKAKTYDYEAVTARYLYDLIELYERKNAALNFKYIQTEYIDSSNADNVIKGTADSLYSIMVDKKIPRIKFVGGAGMGKTMMLEYLEYKLAKERLEVPNKALPILIKCADVDGVPVIKGCFKQLIHDKLSEYHDSSKTYFTDIIKNENLLILIDGLNEILDISKKKAFISELKDFIDKNPTTQFIMTERQSNQEFTITGAYVKLFRMENVSEKVTKEFLDTYLSEDSDKQLILDKMQSSQEFRNFVGTPYYLMLLINCIKDGQSKIPETAEELMEISIRAIIEREKEKGQPAANYPYLMIYLIEFYSAMDVSIDPHGLPIIKIIDIFAKVTKDKTLSPEIYAADKLLALFEELKLLKNSNDMICFENELIENFVLGKALEEPGSGIEELDFSGLFD